MITTVRNGQKVWPFCSTCGCRLNFFKQIGMDVGRFVFFHYGIDRYNRQVDVRNHWCKFAKFEWTLPETSVYGGIIA